MKVTLFQQCMRFFGGSFSVASRTLRMFLFRDIVCVCVGGEGGEGATQ